MGSIHGRFIRAAAAVAVFLGGGIAVSAEDAPVEAEAEDDEKEGGIGLNVDVTFATAYVFRGWNIFQDGDQRDANMLLAPGISWSVFDTGLTLGYWSAYQLNGDDVGGNIDSGVGAEQDLYASYDVSFWKMGLSGWLYYYFFPAARESAAGTANPSYLEPGLTMGISFGLDLAIAVSYFAGLQGAVRDYSYFYVNPSVGKTIELREAVSFEVSFGYGYKAWLDETAVDNTHDILFTMALPISLPAGFYVTPAFHVSHTNIEPVSAMDADHPHLPSGHLDDIREQPYETIVWGSLNVGVEL